MISELYRYPLKGGSAEALSSCPVLGTGFPQDRRWLLVDGEGRFVSQRSHPNLALVKTLLGEDLHFQANGQSLHLPLKKAYGQRRVTVWDDTVDAWDLGDEAAEFFSKILGQSMRLCEAKPGSERQVDSKYTLSRSVQHLFADGFPYLIISQESLDLLNQKLAERGQASIGMDRFRPNIVIKGWQAHAEDRVQTIRIGSEIIMRLAKPCTRCSVPQIDQSTGLSGKEPLATMVSYRKLGGTKIYFGMNAWLVEGTGKTIRPGDPVEVLAEE